MPDREDAREEGVRETADGQSVGARWQAAAGWIVVVTVLWGADLLVKMSERDAAGFGKDDFRLISEQVTSAVAVLIMIPLVLRWLRMFPLRRDAWAAAVVGHTVGSIFFAFGHHSLMIAMRIPWYAFNGLNYVWREHFVSNLVVEYQKDIKIYAGILLVATAGSLYRRSRPSKSPLPGGPTAPDPRRDELSAGPVPAPATAPRAEDAAGPTPERFLAASGGRLLVQTGKGNSVVRYEDIECLEAARNYVTVHAAGGEYVVRETMSKLMDRLSGGPFARTHRSYIVNIDQIEEIRPVDSRQCIRLKSGREIPLSRGYRDAFTEFLTG
jgi:hypothetical protein